MSRPVTATCPRCGPVDFRSDAVTVALCENRLHLSRYQFRCPCCLELVEHRACAKVLVLLRGTGATFRRWTVPAEALEHHGGPALTNTDLVDLIIALHTTDQLTRYIARDGAA